MTLLGKYKKIMKYLSYSILSTILDVIVVWITFHMIGIHLAAANTLGILAGFILSYILSIKTVFDTQHSSGAFTIYFLTSVLGTILANYLITTTYDLSIIYVPEWFAFFLSKGVSIILPFFIMYFIRKFLYTKLNKRRSHL